MFYFFSLVIFFETLIFAFHLRGPEMLADSFLLFLTEAALTFIKLGRWKLKWIILDLSVSFSLKSDEFS